MGVLSGAAAAWTVEQPLLAIISGGYNDVLGITTFEDNAILYLAILGHRCNLHSPRFESVRATHELEKSSKPKGKV